MSRKPFEYKIDCKIKTMKNVHTIKYEYDTF